MREVRLGCGTPAEKTLRPGERESGGRRLGRGDLQTTDREGDARDERGIVARTERGLSSGQVAERSRLVIACKPPAGDRVVGPRVRGRRLI